MILIASPRISVVVPVYNESENIRPLLSRLVPVLESAAPGGFEVIFVDDGSRDGSADILDNAHVCQSRLKVIHLSRNFGHQAALQAGLDFASGDAVVLMDADLQDPPEILPQFIERWHEGYEVVYAVRRKRKKESLFKRGTAAIFYRTMKAFAEIDIPLDSGDFCLLDRRVVDALLSLRERSRFLRGLRSWVGFKQVGVEYDRDPRHAGTTKYTLSRMIRFAVSGYLGFSAMPLRLASWTGFLAAGIGFLMLLWVLASKFLHLVVQGWASIVGVVLFVGGTQLVMLGVMGEYLSRIYDEVRARPLYIVSSQLGFGASSLPQSINQRSQPTTHTSL